MPGNQLVPYDPDLTPRYQPRKPSLFERFRNGIESLIIGDQRHRDLSLRTRYIIGILYAPCAAFMIVGICTFLVLMILSTAQGYSWRAPGDGQTDVMLKFGWDWLQGTLKYWREIVGITALIYAVIAYGFFKDHLPGILEKRRRQRQNDEAAARDRPSEYEHALKLERYRDQQRQAALQEHQERSQAYHAGRARVLRTLEQQIREAVDRERFAHMAEDEPTEAPYQRVRAALKKMPLPAEYGVLHDM